MDAAAADNKDLKKVVIDKYSLIANQSKSQNASSCCGAGSCCDDSTYTIFSESYASQKGYNPDADLSLGCGIPTDYAGIKLGDIVLDLGSGAGNDCFVARAIVGESGKVTGIDFTDAMLEKANKNIEKLGYKNVSFVKGDIEEMPLPDNQFDVIISNCVLNLVPDKSKAFSEIMRVLKVGGHFCVSDVVIKGTLPEKLRKDAEMYAGCVSGALPIDEYMGIINKTGFKNATIHKQKVISVPAEILSKYMESEDISRFEKGEIGIFSITVSAIK